MKETFVQTKSEDENSTPDRKKKQTSAKKKVEERRVWRTDSAKKIIRLSCFSIVDVFLILAFCIIQFVFVTRLYDL